MGESEIEKKNIYMGGGGENNNTNRRKKYAESREPEGRIGLVSYLKLIHVGRNPLQTGSHYIYLVILLFMYYLVIY